MQPQDLREGKLTDMREEGGCDKKKAGVPGKVMLAKNFPLKEISGIFQNIESTKDKMLEADPNLENSRTLHRGAGKTLALHCKFHNKKKETSAVSYQLGKFFFFFTKK